MTVSYAWFGPGSLSSETSNVLSLGRVVVGQQSYCEITADDGNVQVTAQSQLVTIEPISGNPLGLLISEIFPNPVGVDAEVGEYVEIHNPTSEAILLDYIRLEASTTEGGYVALSELTGTLQPGDYWVVSNVPAATLPNGSYSACIYADGFSHRNGGSTVRLVGTDIGHSVTYSDFSTGTRL